MENNEYPKYFKNKGEDIYASYDGVNWFWYANLGCCQKARLSDINIDKILKMENYKTTEEFDNAIIEYLVTNYNCDKERAVLALHNCLAYEWALCDSPNGVVGIQTTYDRSEVMIGKQMKQQFQSIEME